MPTPMLASASQPPGTDAWPVELKFDGMRGLVVCTPRRCRIYSRTRREVTSSFPDVVDNVRAALGDRSLTLDGELIVIAPDGRNSFAHLQRRIHLARPLAAHIRSAPVEFVGFDVLELDGRDTTGLTYDTRRALLLELNLEMPGTRVVPAWPGGDAERVLAAVADAGLEGIVSKRRDSTYQPGQHRTWVKTAVRRSADALIAGWLPGTGAHAASLGALILAGHDAHNQLRYIGCVGTGFTTKARQVLRATLEGLTIPHPAIAGPIPREVLRAGHFVEPILVADIAYREISADGSLRPPSFRGIKPDVPPDTVRHPTPS